MTGLFFLGFRIFVKVNSDQFSGFQPISHAVGAQQLSPAFQEELFACVQLPWSRRLLATVFECMHNLRKFDDEA